jgi:hypothetical protein
MVQLTGRRTDAIGMVDPDGTSADRITPTTAQWWVRCADPFGRCRAMNIVVQHGKVIVVAPPGQAAVLSAKQTRQLGRALGTAAASALPDPAHD